MRVGTIYYNENTDVTEIKWTDGFASSDWITKMDVIKDIGRIATMANDFVYDHHKDGFCRIPRNTYSE